jgi:hypothetical protein
MLLAHLRPGRKDNLDQWMYERGTKIRESGGEEGSFWARGERTGKISQKQTEATSGDPHGQKERHSGCSTCAMSWRSVQG